MNLNERTVDSKEIFNGKVLKLRLDTVELPNGNFSTREVIEHNGGVGIVALTDAGEIVMVKQFRKPLEKVILEIPAGKLNKCEDPLDCGIRELEEETGYKAGKITTLGHFIPSPGFANEVLYLYLATDLKKGEINLDEDEFVETELIPLRDLYNMIMEGKIIDGKTIIGILKTCELLKNEE